MNITVEDILEAFSSFLETESDDISDPGDDILFISVVVKELEAVLESFSGMEVSPSIKLSVACARIPGLLHLYKIY